MQAVNRFQQDFARVLSAQSKLHMCDGQAQSDREQSLSEGDPTVIEPACTSHKIKKGNISCTRKAANTLPVAEYRAAADKGLPGVKVVKLKQRLQYSKHWKCVLRPYPSRYTSTPSQPGQGKAASRMWPGDSDHWYRSADPVPSSSGKFNWQ